MSVLVIDIGSSSTRALLFDDEASLLDYVSVSYQFATDQTGKSTIDADLLLAKVDECLDDILQSNYAQNITVVGMDTFVGNILGVNAQDNAITPLHTYADTCSAETIHTLQQNIDTFSSHQRTGCILHPAYWPARLHWFQQTQPETYSNVAQWIDIATYIYRKWFENQTLPTSFSVASWNGLLNRERLDWDNTWLDILRVDTEKLPQLADYNALQQGLAAKYARRWPELAKVPFCLAVGDGAAANIGSGCYTQERIALTIGTTAAIRVATTTFMKTVPDGLWNYRLTAQQHLIGGATSEGGNIFAWAQDVLKLGHASELDDHLQTREPDAHNLTFLPLLNGERSPGWHSNATGTLHGLRLSTSPLDIIQAALEGVALRLAVIADQLSPVLPTESAVIAGGGAMNNSKAWAQMLANALNRRVEVTNENEVTARGTAILALRAMGRTPRAELPDIAYSVEPYRPHVAVLKAARERQQDLYQRIYHNANSN